MANGIETWMTENPDWYGEGYTRKVAQREYVVVSEVRGVQRGGTVDVTLCLDPATGLVVWNVEAYEKWISA